MTTEEAKDFLREQGYYVDNLWHVDDVTQIKEMSADDAQDVLDKALQNDATMEQIWFAINCVIENDF